VNIVFVMNPFVGNVSADDMAWLDHQNRLVNVCIGPRRLLRQHPARPKRRDLPINHEGDQSMCARYEAADVRS